MEQKILDLLRAVDDPENCEYHPDFDYDEAMQRVQSLKPELDRIAGEPFWIDKNVQDASFFTNLILKDRKNVSSKKTLIYTLLGVRFSYFGNLFTIWSSSPSERLDKEKVEAIIKTVEARGFVYIDEASLAEPYSGSNRYLQGLGS